MNKVLIIGAGGREHALAKAFSQSPLVSQVFVAPGRAGMEDVATPVDIGVLDFDALVDFCKKEEVALTFVGPEVPLVHGVVDRFEQEGLRIFGPNQAAAQIEGSKSFAKDFMKKHAIPTAGYEVFCDYAAACAYIETQSPPFVLKADGLAEGKGVVIALTLEEAKEALSDMLEKGKLGQSGATVVIEEFLDGEEFSFMAFVRGKDVYPMLIAQDHKRAYDGDQGPNTGGMGAYAPVPQIPQEMIDFAETHILEKTAAGMVEDGVPFTGILYAGLIATSNGPKVIEFNARFGDPETEVVLPLLDSDLFANLTDLLDGKTPQFVWSKEQMIGVMMASKGYPGAYDKGFVILGLEDLAEDTFVFHCGTKKTDAGIVTDGGRVLLVARRGSDIHQLKEKLYEDIAKVQCENLFYRKDIGGRIC